MYLSSSCIKEDSFDFQGKGKRNGPKRIFAFHLRWPISQSLVCSIFPSRELWFRCCGQEMWTSWAGEQRIWHPSPLLPYNCKCPPRQESWAGRQRTRRPCQHINIYINMDTDRRRDSPLKDHSKRYRDCRRKLKGCYTKVTLFNPKTPKDREVHGEHRSIHFNRTCQRDWALRQPSLQGFLLLSWAQSISKGGRQCEKW